MFIKIDRDWKNFINTSSPFVCLLSAETVLSIDGGLKMQELAQSSITSQQILHPQSFMKDPNSIILLLISQSFIMEIS